MDARRILNPFPPGGYALPCQRTPRRVECPVPMKTNIHPEYHEVLVHCACGETWTTRSTKKELRIEICSKCHPFFTGKQKLVDSAGRVERFRKRYEKKAAGASS